MFTRSRTASIALGFLLASALIVAACGEGNVPANSRPAGEEAAAAKGADAPSGPAPTILSRSRGGSSALNTGQQPTPLPGLTIRHSERQELLADEAFAVGLYLIRNAQNPFVDLPVADRAKLLAALRSAGFADGDITLSRNPQFGPYTQIQVRVPLATLPEAGKKVFQAISDSIGAAEQTGAIFGLKDCTAQLAPVRKAAFEGADQRARAAATAGNLKLGQVIAVTETFGAQNPYEQTSGDPCASSGAGQGFKGGPGFGLRAIDAPAVVDVTLDLTVTYALADSPGQSSAGITVVGTGKVVAKADEAYVVILVETGSGPTGPRPLAQKDRDALLAALKALGIDEDDVQITNSQFGGPTVVSVETRDLAKLVRLGRDVENAVEDALGRSISKGVVFTHSRCELAAGEARKEAVADAADRAKSLAVATGLKAGALRAIAESPVVNPYGPPVSDACSEDAAVFAGAAYGGGQQLKDFSAAPEFEVVVALSVTYTIGG